MTVYLPIIGYAPAEGAGAKGTTPEGKKNAANLAAVSKAMSWIDSHSADLIGNCGSEYRHLTTPFHYFEGSRVAFDSDIVFRKMLGRILHEYKDTRICLVVPSRELFFDDFESEVLRVLWDREEHGLRTQVLSAKCEEYPLRNLGQPRKGMFDYLCENALRSNNYMVNWVNGSRSSQ